MAGAAVDPDHADHVQHQVLGGDARCKLAVDGDRHGPRLALQQALRRQHVADFACADPERERAERAVGRGVAVATDNRHARLGDAEFRSYHMHDALEPGGDIEKADAVFGAVPAQFPDHGVSRSVRERFRLVVRGNDVVHGGKGTFRVTHGQAQIPDHSESLWRGDFMQQVRSDEHLRSPIRQDADGMSVPDFLEKRFPHN